jgi:hypothetical protein
MLNLERQLTYDEKTQILPACTYSHLYSNLHNNVLQAKAIAIPYTNNSASPFKLAT